MTDRPCERRGAAERRAAPRAARTLVALATLAAAHGLASREAAAQPASTASASAASAPPPAPPPPPTLPPKTPSTRAGSQGGITASCVEHVPDGARRPEMSVTFPERGLAGYEARLEVVVRHGAGETVLPEGLRVQRDSEAFRAITAAKFIIPEPDGGSGARIDVRQTEGATATTLSLPFVPLPPTPGRHELELPPIPIAVARASGELLTLCTPPQRIQVEDPVASEADPEVKPNPPPRPQREPWQAAKLGFYGGLLLVALALLLGWLIHRWLNRPRSVPAPPRPLPWIAALEELERIRRSSLLSEGRQDEYYDRVNDCVRQYLGERYGFDGLESTTDEMRRWLGRVRPRPPELSRIVSYLEDADLIKFADVQPSDHDCRDAHKRATRVVHVTTPVADAAPTHAPADAAGAPAAAPEPTARDDSGVPTDESGHATPRTGSARRPSAEHDTSADSPAAPEPDGRPSGSASAASTTPAPGVDPPSGGSRP